MSNRQDRPELDAQALLDLAAQSSTLESTLRAQMDEAEKALEQLKALSAALGGDGQDALTQKALARQKELMLKIQSVQKLAILANSRDILTDLLEDIGTPEKSSAYLESIGVRGSNLSIEDVKALKAELDEQDFLADKMRQSDVDAESSEKIIALILRDRDKLKKQLNATKMVVANEVLEAFSKSLTAEDVEVYRDLLGAKEEDGHEAVEVAAPQTEEVPTSTQLAKLPEPIADLPSAIEAMSKGDVGLVRIDERLPNQPDILHSMTIADMRAQGITIAPDVVKVLEQLGERVPLLRFEGLTQAEALQVNTIVEAKMARDRESMVGDFVDMAHRILMASQSYMKGKIPAPIIRAAEYVESSERKDESYSPTAQTLNRIACGAIMIKPQHLLTRNVDLDPSGMLQEFVRSASNMASEIRTADAEIEVDFSTFFALLAVQDVVMSKQMQESVETLVPSYEELIRFHADLILKLEMHGKKFVDFSDQETLKGLQQQIHLLKSIVFYAKQYGRITPLQKTASLKAFQSYRATVSLLLQSPELSTIVDLPLVRQTGDTKSACTEIIMLLDDEPLSGRGQEKIMQNISHAYKCINEIVTKLAERLPRNPLRDPRFRRTNRVSIVREGEINDRILQVYFDMPPAERAEFKTECLRSSDPIKPRPAAETEVIERFFEIANTYLPIQADEDGKDAGDTPQVLH